MKRLKILIAASLLTSCAALSAVFAPADMIPAGEGSALLESASLVVQRHDAYVLADTTLTTDDQFIAIAQSDHVLELARGLPEVQVDALCTSLRPVLVRHDAYVSRDASIDQLERDIYLETSARLEALLAQAEAGRRP